MAIRIRLSGRTSLHRLLNAECRRFSEEAQAAAHRCHEDVWLERLLVETEECESVSIVQQGDEFRSIDLSALIEEAMKDPDLRVQAIEMIRVLTAKIPAGTAAGELALTEDIGRLLHEAKAIVLANAIPAERTSLRCAS